jgi:Tfp pilus assembly protein PilO
MKTDIKQLMQRLERIQLDKKKIIVIVLAAAVILYLDGAFLVRSQFRGAAALSKKVAGLQKDIGVFKKEYANLANYKETQAQLIQKSKRLITPDQKQAFAEYLYDVAHKSQIKILQWKPDADVKIKEETVNRKKLIPYSMTMGLLCGYHELGAFINALENGTLYVAVTDLKISPGPLDSVQQSVTVTLKIYAKK